MSQQLHSRAKQGLSEALTVLKENIHCTFCIEMHRQKLVRTSQNFVKLLAKGVPEHGRTGSPLSSWKVETILPGHPK